MLRHRSTRQAHVLWTTLGLAWVAVWTLTAPLVHAQPAEAHAQPAEAHAQPAEAHAEPGSLTLEDAIEEAMDAGARVRAAEAAHEEASLRASWRTSAYLPEAAATISTRRSQYPQTVTPIREPGVFPELDETIHEARLDASWTVFDFGQGQAARRAAQSVARATGVQYDRARMETIEAVAGAFVRLAQLHALIQAQKARRTALQEQSARINDLHAEGRVADVERLKIREVVLKAAADLRSTQRQQKNVLQALTAELGRSRAVTLDTLQLKPLPAYPDETDVEEEARSDAYVDAGIAEERARLDRAPRVAAAEARLEAATARQAEATRALLPAVELFGTEQIRSGSSWDADAQWSVGLRLTVPLTPFRATAQREAQQAATRAREIALSDARRQLRVALNDLDTQLRDAMDRAATAAARNAQLAETYRIESAAYAEGRLTLTDLLDTEAKLAAARSEQAAARAEVAHIRLRQGVLTGRLTANNAVERISATL